MLHRRQELCSTPAVGSGRLVLVQGDPGTIGQETHRLRVLETLDLSHEADGVAPLAWHPKQ